MHHWIYENLSTVLLATCSGYIFFSRATAYFNKAHLKKTELLFCRVNAKGGAEGGNASQYFHE
jgi:hypothetical protein